MELFSITQPTTVVAGAGLSAAAPTCLPGWWALNDAVLQALGNAVERVTGRSELSKTFQSVITTRRDSTPFLKPDLQAQLIEDEVGDAYFTALAHVDSTVLNAAHELLAELARQRRVGAIITTNFDCTIERALDARGVSYELYTSPPQFEQLTTHPSDLAVIKVHGSSTQPSTMVDTLRQRLYGRPDALNGWMLRRFVEFPTLAIGFSGEDLQYDPNYLSIRAAASGGARFLFLVRDPQPSVPLQRLKDEFPALVLSCRGELPGWLFDLLASRDIGHDVSSPLDYSEGQLRERRARARQDLESGLNEWASSLSRMRVINAVTALISAAGQRQVADHLLRRTWEFYRTPEDCQGGAYARYLQNYGDTLLRGARLRNPHDRVTQFAEWRAAADEDPRQFFHRAVACGGTEAAAARALLCDFLAGARIPSLGPTLMLALERLTEAGAGADPLSLSLIDAAFSLVEVLELCALGQAGTAVLEASHRSAVRLGDEFRRSEAAWRLARHLGFGIHSGPANRERIANLAAESSAISARLNIRESDVGSALARSIAAAAAEDWETAAREAVCAEDVYRELGDLLGVCFAKRERVRALVGQGLSGTPVKGSDFDELSEWLQTFALENAPGLRPIIHLELAMVALHFDDTLATQLLTDAAEGAALQEHPYVGNKAHEMLASLKSGENAGT